MALKKILLCIITIHFIGTVFAKNTVFEIDFTQEKNADGHKWLVNNGFEDESKSNDIVFKIKDGKLISTSTKPRLSIYSKKINLENVKTIRIEWGVIKDLNGSSYEKGIYREPLGITVTFGKETYDSGSFIIPNLPYFITFLMNKNDMPGKLYTGRFHKKAGRYTCFPCEYKLNETVVTEVNLQELFNKAFNKKMPVISGLGIDTDTRDTDGKSIAFIKNIRFFD